jgi:hypothetical protein
MVAQLVPAILNQHVELELQQERTAGLKAELTLHTDWPVPLVVHRRHRGVAQAPGQLEGVGLVGSVADRS